MKEKKPSWITFTMLLVSFMFFNLAMLIIVFKDPFQGLFMSGLVWLAGIMAFEMWRRDYV